MDKRTLKNKLEELREFRNDYATISIPTKLGALTVTFHPPAATKPEKQEENPRDKPPEDAKPRKRSALFALTESPPESMLTEVD